MSPTLNNMKKYSFSVWLFVSLLTVLTVPYFFSTSPVQAQTPAYAVWSDTATCNGETPPQYNEIDTFYLGENRSCASGTCGTMWCQTHRQECMTMSYTCLPEGWSANRRCEIYQDPAPCDTSSCSATNWPNCSGSGNPPPSDSTVDFSMAATPSTRSIFNGQTTNYEVTVTPIQSMGNASVALTVSGCPSGAACTFPAGNTLQFEDLPNPPALSRELRVVANSASPGTYTLTVTGSYSGVSRTTSVTLVIYNAASNNSYCLSITAPDSVTPGQQFTMSARLRNTGTKTWDNIYTSSSDQEHFLGTWSPSGDAWGPGSGRTRLPNGTPVPQNGEVIFTRTLTAPNAVGSYGFQFAMVEDGVEWMIAPGSVCVKPGGITVNSTPPPPVNNSACGIASVPPSVAPGESFNASITMHNNGTTMWTPSGANNYHLLVSPWPNTTWNGARTPLPVNVNPNGSYTFTLPLTAPATEGTYAFSAQMLQEGVAWFGAICGGTSIRVTNSPPTATISPSANSTTVGRPIVFTVTGNSSSGLSSVGLEGYTSTGIANANLGETNVSGTSASRTFSWTPTAVGTYYFGGFAWSTGRAALGRTAPPISITVGPVPPPTNPVSSCPAPGTSGSVAWTLPTGYTQVLLRAYDTSSDAPCTAGPNQLCTGPYTGSSYSFTGSSAPAMVPGRSYSWWVHTYDGISGTYSNAISGSFTCTNTPRPNLTAAPVSENTATAGTPRTFTSLITNNGDASTGASFSNFFQIATAANGGGTITDLAASTMSALNAGANNTATSPSYTFGSAGTYSVRACADKSNAASTGVIAESNENDNCSSNWTTVNVSASVASCDPSAVGTNQMLGCAYTYPAGSPGFNSLQSTIPALVGNTLSSPAPTNATLLPQTDWGNGGPGTLADNYSIRWRGNFNLPAGTYTFSTWSDDGSRAYLDANNDNIPDSGYLVNDWSDHGPRTTSGSPIALAAGVYRIVYEMYEAGGGATHGLSWTSTPTLGTGEIRGKICKDDNGSGSVVCDAGELFIRDASAAQCGAKVSSPQTGFSINYSGPQSGSRLLDACSSSTSDPIFLAQSVQEGTYTVTPTLPAGWTFTACRVNGVSCAQNNFTSVVVPASGMGVVEFAVRQPVSTFTLTVTKTIGGNVTSADGLINCGATCSRSYPDGTQVVLTAVPDTAQWRFVGWSGAGCSGTSTCTVTVDSSQPVVRAQFRPRSLQYQEF